MLSIIVNRHSGVPIIAAWEDKAGVAAGPPRQKATAFVAREGRVQPRPHGVRP